MFVSTLSHSEKMVSYTPPGSPPSHSPTSPDQYKWQYQDDHGSYEDLIETVSDECEDLYTAEGMRTALVKFELNGTTYQITVGLHDATNSFQLNQHSGKRRKVRRVCCTETWECNACTYKNREELSTCEICGNDRKPAPANATAVTPASNATASTPAAPKKDQRGMKRTLTGTKKLESLANIPTQYEFLICTYLNTLTDDGFCKDKEMRRIIYDLFQKYYRTKYQVDTVDQSRLKHSDKCFGCLESFGGTVAPAHLSPEAGGNSAICLVCLQEHIKCKINEGEVTPWIRSPCYNFTNQPLTPGNVLLLLDATPSPNHRSEHRKLIHNFIKVYCRQIAQQHLKEDFLVCTECEFGLCKSQNPTIQHCPNCSVELPTIVIDDTMQKMLDNGSMRKSSCCGQLHHKQYGVCNVIQCQGCNMYFNWNSNDFGKDSKELKQKARDANTLWQPGEQEYQANLRATDEQAFIELLKSNGVDYDPNYVPGQD